MRAGNGAARSRLATTAAAVPRSLSFAPEAGYLRSFATGRVTVERGVWGYIRPDEGTDLGEAAGAGVDEDFFWGVRVGVADGFGLPRLRDHVEFDLAPDDREPGKFQAVNIRGGRGRTKVPQAQHERERGGGGD